MLILLVYLIGVVLSYGIVYGSLVKAAREGYYPLVIRPSRFWIFALSLSLLSLIGLPANILLSWLHCETLGFKFGIAGE